MTTQKIILLFLLYFYRNIVCVCLAYIAYTKLKKKNLRKRRTHPKGWSTIAKVPDQFKNLRLITETTDQKCIDLLRMDRNCFARLVYLLENVGGLKNNKFVTAPFKVAMFLNILAHHEKNRSLQHTFARSGHTISIYFRETLTSLIRVSNLLLVDPVPIPDNCDTDPWKFFKGCLGALDGTHVEVRAPMKDKRRYINSKGDPTVNVLGVCNKDLNFIYMLTGWEGSAADSRILRDAITRPNGLRVPQGNYYLCDSGYTNCEGFLTPYRMTRYHLDEWGNGLGAPQNAREFFNLKHCKARNVVERAFGLLKTRWACLRSQMFYPIRIQNLIILSCGLLHNFIRTNMEIDPAEEMLDQNPPGGPAARVYDYVETVETTPEWSAHRDAMAYEMYTAWRTRRRGSACS